ncbi:MAG: DUF547 domain-containing protein [Acidobacteria bacterium]|nr:DUF547 domain-containing protein [Acidobacteriota bacterium]MCA1611243.1 DUF547 domain-containing protein [Acidobacteriota bacterium]
MKKSAAFFPLFLLLVSACAVNVPAPKSAAAPAGAAAPATTTADADKTWARVLSKYVDDSGRIDFAGVAKDRADLDAYVAWIGRVSPANTPASFPTKESKLAYYLNAYNALAMYNVIESGQPKDLNAVKVRFFYRNKLSLGGEKMSLYDLENKIVRPMGDPRVHFALNCMVRGCPRLPREPFRADQLDMELEATAQYFLNENRNVQPEPDRQTVRFSQILQFYTDDFLKKSPSLVAYANKYREAKIPEGSKVEFIPYDWTLNQR